MLSRSHTELAVADRRIAEADRNIRQLGSLVPQLARDGYATADIEDQLELMTEVLHRLRAQRSTIVAALERDELPPPHRRLDHHDARRMATAASHDAPAEGFRPWRTLYKRLSGS